MRKNDLLKALNIDESTDLFDSVYDSALSEFKESGVFYLNRGFVEDIQKKYHPFTEYYDFILEMVDRVSKKPVLSLFSLILHRMIEKNKAVNGKNISMPERTPFESSEDETDFEFTGFFAHLAFTHEMADFYLGRGLPTEYFTDTLHDMYETAGIYAYSLTAGRLGFNNTTYFSWNQYYIYHKIVKIGVLNYEVGHPFPELCVALRNQEGEYRLLAYNKGVTEKGYILGTLGDEKQAFFADFKETETHFSGYLIDELNARITREKVTLSKDEWQVAIRPGDEFLNVHIPRSGKISKENNDRSYKEAIRIHKLIFPEKDIKAIGCMSWLLSPDLCEMLPESSNILAFQKAYRKFPLTMKNYGKAVFSFLFPRKVDRYEDLAEDTSLQRKVKARYLDGGAVIEAAGLIFPDEIQ